MAVRRAQAEVLHQATAPLLQHAVERGAKAVAVERVQNLEPVRGRPLEGAAPETEEMLGLRAGENPVGGDVPVPDQIAGAGERERAPFDVRYDAVRDTTRERVLHYGEADQHDNQFETAEQGGADDVVGYYAFDR